MHIAVVWDNPPLPSLTSLTHPRAHATSVRGGCLAGLVWSARHRFASSAAARGWVHHAVDAPGLSLFLFCYVFACRSGWGHHIRCLVHARPSFPGALFAVTDHRVAVLCVRVPHAKDEAAVMQYATCFSLAVLFCRRGADNSAFVTHFFEKVPLSPTIQVHDVCLLTTTPHTHTSRLCRCLRNSGACRHNCDWWC